MRSQSASRRRASAPERFSAAQPQLPAERRHELVQVGCCGGSPRFGEFGEFDDRRAARLFQRGELDDCSAMRCFDLRCW